MKRLLLAVALLASALSSSGGQSLSTLPRATVPTGLNDSTLVMVADSARRTRAARALDFRAMLALRAFDSLATASLRLPGTLNLTGGSITGSPSATFGAITVSGCTGCAPAVVDSATGAARAQILTTARTIGGTSFNGSANIVPGLADSSTGSTRAQKLTTARTIGGTSFDGTANITPGLSDSSTGSTRAQTLTTSRTLWGQSFDGSANVSGAMSSVGKMSVTDTVRIIKGVTGASFGALRLDNSDATANGGVSIDLLHGGVLKWQLKTSSSNNDDFVILGNGSQQLRFGLTTATATLTDTLSVIGRIKNIDGTAAIPSYAFTNSIGLGVYRFGADTLGFAAGGSAAFRMSSGALQGPDGTFTNVAYGFTGSVGMGMYRNGTSLFLSNGGFQQIQVRTDSIVFNAPLAPGYGIGFQTAATITGGPGSMTIQSGTGNSRRLVVQTTTSAGAATTAVRFNEAQQALFTSGTATRPGIVFAADTTLGFYRSGADAIAVGSAGFNLVTFAQTGLTMASGYPINATSGVNATGTTAGTPAYRITNPGTNNMGMYKYGDDTLGFSSNGAASMGIRGGATPTWFGGAGDLIIQAGVGNNRAITLQTTGPSGTPATAFTCAPSTGFCATGQPDLRINNSTDAVIMRVGANSLGLRSETSTATGITLTGATGAPTITGTAGDMTMVAGTGNNRNIVLKATNGSGTAVTIATMSATQFGINNLAGQSFAIPAGTLAAPGMVFTDDGDTGIHRGDGDNANDSITVVVNGVVGPSFKQDTVRFPGKLAFSGLTTEPSTQSALCINNGGGQVYINAAATCTVSSLRFKENIATLSLEDATRIAFGLRPVTFDYKADHSRAIGLVAEEANVIDPRLATRDAQGRVNSVNYEQVTILLLAIVKDQQRQLDSLKAAGRKP